MVEYIDRKAVLESLKETEKKLSELYDTAGTQDVANGCYGQLIMLIECILRIKEQPTADVAPVIYCKDCKHAKELGEAEKKIWLAECLICTSGEATIDGYNIVMPEHYCSYGKRKSGTQPQREDI